MYFWICIIHLPGMPRPLDPFVEYWGELVAMEILLQLC